MPTPVAAFDFELPEHLIAQEARARGQARLLVVDRASASWEERSIADLPSILQPGDQVVANDTRVFPARLIGRRDPSGGVAECFLLERVSDHEWEALVHPGQKLKPGARLRFDDPVRAPGVRIDAEVLERRFFGRRLVRFAVEGAQDFDAAVDRLGHVPLPPYIRRDERTEDSGRYQSVYARERGSVAAPTAGLHFDEPLIAALRAAGIGWHTLTLHVGYGTFKPVRATHVEEHEVDPERFQIPADTAAAIASARAAHRRVVAIGTTTTRALESVAGEHGTVAHGDGRTGLFIHPGYRFKVVDALLTNFHLPCSSLLMLVAAFGGKDLVLAAYRDAVARQFRFYSYGDAMLIV
ncbi:MAG: tRNA preQ1(34) S-adenosylmethionine ribosyltransferase-isomerase QueA [Vicinamibacterales bacterium]